MNDTIKGIKSRQTSCSTADLIALGWKYNGKSRYQLKDNEDWKDFFEACDEQRKLDIASLLDALERAESEKQALEQRLALAVEALEEIKRGRINGYQMQLMATGTLAQITAQPHEETTGRNKENG